MLEIADGVWPTMITPFTEGNEIDYPGLEKMIHWYLERRVNGLFAVCQSSEMFFLSLEERAALARFVKKEAGSKAPVIASGHISDTIQDQIEEMKHMQDTGVDAIVIVSNRLAREEESDDIWIRNAEKLLDQVPDTDFGLYECPYPYKRLLSPKLLEWCVSTGRFAFLKDTCCSLAEIETKLNLLGNSKLKLFNANSTTLLHSLRLGAAGFSGVMCNFHPELYVWMTKHWAKDAAQAEAIQAFLSVAALIELQAYPVNAKYHMQLEGLPIQLLCRSKSQLRFTPTQRMEVEHLRLLGELLKSQIGSTGQ